MQVFMMEQYESKTPLAWAASSSAEQCSAGGRGHANRLSRLLTNGNNLKAAGWHHG
jgi:hypothetical protein